MRSFNELKEFSQTLMKTKDLTVLEKSIVEFLSEGSFAEEVFLEDSNLENFIDKYLNSETKNLGKKIINNKNMFLFLGSDNQMAQEIFNGYLDSNSFFSDCKGVLSLGDNNSFKAENSLEGEILNAMSPLVVSEDLREFKEEMSFFQGKIKKIPARIKKEEDEFILTFLKQENEQEVKRKNKLLSKLKTPIQVGVMAMAIFAGTDAMAGEVEQKAIKHATKAVMETPEVKEQVDRMKTYAEKQAKAIVKEVGGEIPAAIIGYGAKVAIDKKIGVDGKVPLTDGMRYEVESDFKNIQLGISGDNPFYEDSQYRFKAGSEEIRFQLDFSF